VLTGGSRSGSGSADRRDFALGRPLHLERLQHELRVGGDDDVPEADLSQRLGRETPVGVLGNGSELAVHGDDDDASLFAEEPEEVGDLLLGALRADVDAVVALRRGARKEDVVLEDAAVASPLMVLVARAREVREVRP